ncbi:MAG: hypothetical protein B6D55_00900 [Candidatus Omnitrophica bacterium 4484_70.2]|nr:MAG: hypothetical protein B6D55_00900 [Candidatus Omnitrophica bacterium 4484_70.2]
MYLGIDWGGTFIKIGLLEKGKVQKKIVFASRRLLKKQIFLQKLRELKEEFSSFKAVGIGAPGIVDIKKGFIYYLPNVEGWENFPLRRSLEKIFKVPVFVDNDANLFGLGELKKGVAQGKKRVIFLTLGTGVGSSVAFEGKIVRGENSAFELGHVPLVLRGERCSCGSSGCIETFVGAKYLRRKYYRLKREKVEVVEIFQRAKNKEREAISLWNEMGYYLGRFLAGMVNIFNPELIVLGGGVSGAFPLFKDSLWKAIKRHTMWPYLKNLKIKKAKLKDSALVGAFILAQESLRKE